MEVAQSVNRSWICESYFSLYRPIHPGEMSGGNCPNTDKKIVTLEAGLMINCNASRNWIYRNNFS